MKDLAERRKLEDLTIGPVLTVSMLLVFFCTNFTTYLLHRLVLLQFTTEAMLEHANKLLQISGSKLLFGGEPLEDHSIPPVYGAIKPTAIYVPLEEMLKENNYELVTREIFGPFQVTRKDMQLKYATEVLLYFSEWLNFIWLFNS